MPNKNTGGVKSASTIRNNIVNRQAQPKGLISAEVKKLLYQNIIAYFHKYDGFVTLPPFFVPINYSKGGQVTKPIIRICENML